MDIQQFNSDVVEKLCKRQIIDSDPAIMTGAPVFIGTRVPLQTLFDYIEGEDGLSEFSGDFPHLQIPALQVLETIARVTIERSSGPHRS